MYDKERADRHGRVLAYVVMETGGELQERLLAEGLAWYVAIPPNLARLSRYRALEERAREQALGVWREPSYAPARAAALLSGNTGFRRVAGKVERVRWTDRYVRLEPRRAVRGRRTAGGLALFSVTTEGLRGASAGGEGLGDGV